MQALALDVRVLDKNGEEIQLSTLCNDEEPLPYSNKAELAAIDEALGESGLEDGDLGDLTIEDENGDVIENFGMDDEFGDDDNYNDEYED